MSDKKAFSTKVIGSCFSALSVLCGFFGGGDMNGIALLLPEVAARILFGVILVINGLLFWKVILPKYKMAFSEIR